MENIIKILMLEDVLTDLELILIELKKAKIRFEHLHVESEEGFRKGLVEFNPDLILSDYMLPQFTGIEALSIATEISPLIPFIIVTGTLSEETAVECMKSGATDYVLKENLARLGPAISLALERKALITAKLKAEESLRISEEFNRCIIESSNDCIKLLDLDGNLLYMSNSGQKMLEIDDITLLLNKSWLDYWKGSDRQWADSAIKEARNGSIGSFQGYCPTLKGAPKWWDVSITSITDSEGNIRSLLAISRDMTDRKIAEEKQYESQKKFQVFFEANPLGVCTVNTEGKILHCNSALEKILGYPQSELLNKRLIDFTHPDDMPKSLQYLKDFGEGNRDEILFEKRYIKKDGSTIIANLTVIAYHDNQQNLKFNLVLEDITERKRAEILNKANYEISQLKLEYKTIWKFFAATHQILSQVLDARNLYFAMYDSDADLIEFPYFVDEKDDFQSRKLSGTNSLTEKIIMEMKSFLLDREEFQRMIDNKEIKLRGTVPECWMGVPLIANKKAFGAIVIQSYRNETVYSNEDFQLLQAVSGKISLLIENKLAADALKESEEKYRLIVENAHDGIEITQDDKIIFVNPRFAEMLGYSAEELINSNFSMVYTEKAYDDLLQRQEIRESEQQSSKYYETTYLRKNKTIIDVEVKYEIIQYNGKPATFAIIRDITERKKSETALRESEIKFRQLFSDLPDAIFITEIGGKNRGKIIDFNKEAEKQTGYSRKELCNKNIANDFLVKIDKNSVIQDEKKLLNGEMIRVIEKRKRKDGSNYWAQVQITVIEYEGKKCALSVHRDITEIFKVEEELKRHKENLEELVNERTLALEKSHREVMKLSQAVEQSPATVVITDPNGTIEYVNSTFTHATGYKLQEMMGKTPRVLKSDYHPESFYKNLWETISSGNIWKGEIRNKKKNGELFWESSYISPIMNDKKEIVNYVAVKQDITEQKYALEQLVESKKDLQIAKEIAENATLTKSQFLANMSHEIRTPINAIIGLNRLMQNTALSEKQKDYTKKSQMASQSLLDIINDILDLSKIEAGKLNLESVNFNINDILNNLANMVTMKAHEKGLEIIFAMSKDMPSLLTGDPLRLQQVLLNLTSNAIKFTDRGYIILSSEVIEKTDEKVIIKFSIKDTGVGISRKDQGLLFRTYTQVDTSTTRKYGGTGLGLSISRKLVEMMGGEIGLKSRKGKGSTFFFTVRFDCREQEGITFLQPPVELKGLRLLVVDDMKEIRDLVKDQLEILAFKITVVDSAGKAISELRNALITGKKYYDLVLMDWKINGINGIEASKLIKNDPGIAHKPKIILMSAHITKETLSHEDMSNIDCFLSKPFSLSKLFNTILDIFGKGVKQKYLTNGFATIIPEGFKLIQGARILLVEDNEINQQVAKEMLENEGFWITLANDGREAVQKIRASRTGIQFDAVLMDLQMPLMDGFQASRQIRKELDFLDLPIIAMTADVMGAIRQRCLDAGMNDYVSKPIEPTELYSALLKWIKPGKRELFKPESEADTARDALEKYFSELSDIDMSAGLNRVNQNHDLYIKLLHRFKVKYTTFIAEISQAIAAEDKELSARLAHTLKGVAGNLGAIELFEAARELEILIKENHSEKINMSLKRTENILNRLLNSITKFEEKTHEMLSKDEEITINSEELSASLREGRDLLKEYDADAIVKIEKLRFSLMNSGYVQETEALMERLTEYDFDGVLEIVEALIKSMEI